MAQNHHIYPILMVLPKSRTEKLLEIAFENLT